MVGNLEILRGELNKVQKALQETKAKDYKRYSTLYQVYVGLTNVVNQTEAMQKQATEEAKKEKERQKILKEAEKENKKKAKETENK